MKTFFAAIALSLTTHAFASSPEKILSTTQGGLVVVIGCESPDVLTDLCASDAYQVQGLDTDRERVKAAREYLHKQGRYGQISVATFNGKRLPYIDNLVNAVVVQESSLPQSEIMRVLCPGGSAYIDGTRLQKPWPADIDHWGHFLHGPDNNAVANDNRVGPPRSLVWTHSRRWLRSHEELAGVSSLVSSQGRLFYIVDKAPLASIRYPTQWTLVARDAFNGIGLWEKEIPRWNDHLRIFRSGPTHLPRRLVAQGDTVFVTLGLDAPVVQLDGATGELIRQYEHTEHTEEIIADGGTLYLMIGTSETNREGIGLFARNEPAPTIDRFLVAIDISSGDIKWKRNARGADYILPLGYAISHQRLYIHSINGVHCLDAASGNEIWHTPRPSQALRYSWSTSTLVATKDIVLLVDRHTGLIKGRRDRKTKEKLPDTQPELAKTDPKWIVSCFPDSQLPFHVKDNVLTAYSAKDGEIQWSQTGYDGYNASVDLFVINDTVWVGGFNLEDKKGYDLHTGEAKASLMGKGDRVGMAHHRCYRNKASSHFIFTGRDGIEVLDLEKSTWTSNNSWVRGTCQYGIMPANGYLYAPPNACGCHPKVKLQGLNALSPALPASALTKPDPIQDRLEKGPAYSQVSNPDIQPSASDWPMYRCDYRRSGAVQTTINRSLKPQWSRNLGGRLTQPVSADGMVVVASIDTHTVYALDSTNGRPLWQFTADGRIDSSPTLYKGTVLFGSADGHVYCLRGTDGQLAWRFRAAPETRHIAIYGQLESSWPVHGSVLVQNDELYVLAGRSTYLDGGLYFCRIDPAKGTVLATSTVRHLDPVSGKQITAPERAFDSEGSLNDILSGDGNSIYLKHMRFDTDGQVLTELEDHLFTPGGFLGEQWFVRNYWLYGINTGAGWGSWSKMTGREKASTLPAGRILSFDGSAVYGYGRVERQPRQAGHRVDAYHLFSSPYTKTEKTSTTNWSNTDFDLVVRAMVLADDTLIVSGFPDIARKNKDMEAIAFVNNEEATAALQGKYGSSIYLMDTQTGQKLSGLKLKEVPVFDGMSAANGRIYLGTTAGSLICMGE